MAQLSQLGQVLHEEHFHIVMLFCDLENRVTGPAAQQPLDPMRADDRQQLEHLIVALDDVIQHNAFEELELFPLLCRGGAADMVEMLADEHLVMVPLVNRLRSGAADILEHGVDRGKWERFCAAAQEFTQQILLHLQKEELSIVRALGTLLDRNEERRLVHRHASAANHHHGRMVAAALAD
ncbi:MAG: hemerythrin domain-containing protein [Rhodospirillales bacterium]